MQWQWTGIPREFRIDLRSIATRDEFQRELSRHFPMKEDHRHIWESLYTAISLVGHAIACRP